MTPESPVVELAPGTRALGRCMPPVKGCSSSVYAFLGLPYAQPPVGPLRFQPPQPATLWSGDRDATKHGAICPQTLVIPVTLKLPPTLKFKAPTNASEDCLFLNVWTPSLLADAKKPVMVFIHGGGFISGFSDTFYGTGLVCLGDVLLVSLNYRINVFGFMTTGDDVAPGNYGILDQIEALRWVQKNIRAFGGDPDNVTIFGESAGGMSVSALLVSPLAKGLFRRAICQSGTIRSPGWIAQPRSVVQVMKPLLDKLGCASENSEEIVEFLRQATREDLLKSLSPMPGYVPVIDNVTFHAKDVLCDGNDVNPDVDTLIGCNSHEGALFGLLFSNFQFPDIGTVKNTMSLFVLPSYGAKGEAALTDMMEEYFDEGMMEDEMAKAYVEWCTDFVFVYGSVKTAQAQTNTEGNTYLYWYQYRDPSHTYPQWVLCDHAGELPAVFGWRLFDMSEQIEEFEKLAGDETCLSVSRTLIGYWTNFAKTGDPNGEGLAPWPKYNKESQEHIILDAEISTGSHMMAKRMAFWDKMNAKYPLLE